MDSSLLIMQIKFIISTNFKVLGNIFISLHVELGECSLRSSQVCTVLHALSIFLIGAGVLY